MELGFPRFIPKGVPNPIGSGKYYCDQPLTLLKTRSPIGFILYAKSIDTESGSEPLKNEEKGLVENMDMH